MNVAFHPQKKQKKIAKLPNGNHSDPFGEDDGDVERITRELEAKYVSERDGNSEREEEDFVVNENSLASGCAVCTTTSVVVILFAGKWKRIWKGEPADDGGSRCWL